METGDARISGLKKSKIARTRRHRGDRISSLPEPIIHHIFSFLETIDVIRASAVSRRWRYLWASIPYFNFSIDTILASRDNGFVLVYCIIEQFKDFVNWVLMSRDGSVGIRKFRLSCFMPKDKYAVYRWINVAARSGLQELDLDLRELDLDLRSPSFHLPFSLVSCESLVALKLRLIDRVLQLPNSGGFSRLKFLELRRVALTDETVATKFIKACPLLEDLTMCGCIFRDFKVFEISATNLKKLNIINHVIRGPSGPSGDGFYRTKLKIVCPNLVSLVFKGPLALDFSLQDLSSLENAYISLYNIDDNHITYAHARSKEQQAYVQYKILKGICTANVLRLSMGFLEFLYLAHPVVDSSFISLWNLRHLKLFLGKGQCYMKSTITLLECSPNLEVLTIRFYTSDWSKWDVPDKPISCLTYRLKRVDLFNVEDNENEMGIIKFVLKNGRVLEKMNITWLFDKSANRQESAQKVLKFQRSSPSIVLSLFNPRT